MQFEYLRGNMFIFNNFPLFFCFCVVALCVNDEFIASRVYGACHSIVLGVEPLWVLSQSVG